MPSTSNKYLLNLSLEFLTSAHKVFCGVFQKLYLLKFLNVSYLFVVHSSFLTHQTKYG